MPTGFRLDPLDSLLEEFRIGFSSISTPIKSDGRGGEKLFVPIDEGARQVAGRALGRIVATGKAICRDS